ncbi:GDP-mannose 4,6-dehydratase [Thalassospira sp. MA62]|nr:GDP-mannose 4,6-dehydratase [Thalassospira sp. MA62]
MKNVLVLGSNSPSGAYFCAHAANVGCNVIATSRSAEKADVYLPYKWYANTNANVKFVKLDLNQDMDVFPDILETHKPEFIVNFASQSMVGQSWDFPEHWMQTNVVSLVTLLEHLRHYDGLEKYIHFSTPEVYGSTNGWVRESRHYAPSTPYASSRAAGDMNVVLWHKTYGVPAIITRAANIYGAGQQLFRIIPKAILCSLLGERLPLHGGGYSERAFIHCSDVASAIMRLCEQGEVGEDYHLSPREAISIRNLVHKICEVVDVEFDDLVVESGDRVGKDQAYLLDPQKVKDELGWEPRIGLREGIQDCYDWIKNNLDELKKHPREYLHKK